MMSLINSEKVFLFFIFLIKITSSETNTCNSENNKQLSNTDCFTDIIKFDQDNYRAGHAIVTKNKELLIEFSLDYNSSNRLFYGLKNNGRNYFPDDSFVKIVDIGDDNGIKSRYESMNRMVKINDNTNGETEYILSISTFKTVMELYDPETFNSAITYSKNYLDYQLFSFQFQILEGKINNEYVYFCSFTPTENIDNVGGKETGTKTILTRFKFSSLGFEKTDALLVAKDGVAFNGYWIFKK